MLCTVNPKYEGLSNISRIVFILNFGEVIYLKLADKQTAYTVRIRGELTSIDLGPIT